MICRVPGVVSLILLFVFFSVASDRRGQGWWGRPCGVFFRVCDVGDSSLRRSSLCRRGREVDLLLLIFCFLACDLALTPFVYRSIRRRPIYFVRAL